MESQRQQKYARLLQRDLGEILQRDVKHWFEGSFITVTQVRISPDLRLAKVYLSFLATKRAPEMLERVEERGKQIRHHLAQRIRNQVRVIPELHFFLDDTAEYAARIDALLDKIDIPPPDDDDPADDHPAS
ncbi:MAG: 30S ribosome-binding factor RbfA [Catalinimonas sp.]